jgi:hypothetical protein
LGTLLISGCSFYNGYQAVDIETDDERLDDREIEVGMKVRVHCKNGELFSARVAAWNGSTLIVQDKLAWPGSQFDRALRTTQNMYTVEEIREIGIEDESADSGRNVLILWGGLIAAALGYFIL